MFYWYHFIYSSAPGANDTTILPGAETEIQSITRDMSGLATSSGIQFTAQEINGGLSSGWFFPDSCFSSPYYRDGVECRLTFTDNYRTKFIPYKNGAPAWLAPDTPEENTITDDPVNGNSTQDSPEAQNSSPDTTGQTESTVKIVYVTTTSSTSDINASSSSPTSNYIASTTEPVTNPTNTDDEKDSKNTSTDLDSKEENSESRESNFSVPMSGEGQTTCSTEFPWWFILLVLGIDAVIMFILWPKTRQQKTTN